MKLIGFILALSLFDLVSIDGRAASLSCESFMAQLRQQATQERLEIEADQIVTSFMENPMALPAILGAESRANSVTLLPQLNLALQKTKSARHPQDLAASAETDSLQEQHRLDAYRHNLKEVRRLQNDLATVREEDKLMFRPGLAKRIAAELEVARGNVRQLKGEKPRKPQDLVTSTLIGYLKTKNAALKAQKESQAYEKKEEEKIAFIGQQILLYEIIISKLSLRPITVHEERIAYILELFINQSARLETLLDMNLRQMERRAAAANQIHQIEALNVFSDNLLTMLAAPENSLPN